MRHGRSGPNVNWRHVRLRHAGATLLAASFLLSAVPPTPSLFPAAARAWSESSETPLVDLPDEDTNGRKEDGERPDGGASSVRPRGREAPINLRQVAAEVEAVPVAVGADPGDGPPPERQNEKTTRDDQADEDRRKVNLRMWPMPAESYSFTQAFGCVPQIAHFYLPGAGCPSDRPVVHTGLDLAAPEGTPFYAAASGWVTESGYDREVGVPNTRIIIQHEGRNDGYATEYLHWIASFVDVGDYVEAGQLIGEVGSVGYSTGPHLHFALVDLDSGEHVDPTRWLPKEPGTEGYRGVTPRRAAMRLPAGTTAGVPEYTDPNPPAPPTREDLPRSADAREGRKDRDTGKKAKQREERRDEGTSGKNREKDTRDISGKDGSTSEDDTPALDDNQADRDRERTRTRERNRDGSAESKDASGRDGSGDSRKERRNENADDDSASSRKDDKGQSRKDENAVEQTDTRDKGNDREGNGGGGNEKNRPKEKSQQVADETSAPEEATPPAEQGQEDGSGSGKESENGSDNPDRNGASEGNGGDGQDSRDGKDQATGDGSAEDSRGDATARNNV